MPTRADFEAAAQTFLAASRELIGLTSSVEQAQASEIVRGGALGLKVPTQIASSAAAAQTCKALLEEAAATCSFRASVIAEYEAQLAVYDRSYSSFNQQRYEWGREYDAWLQSNGQGTYPGSQPREPRKPLAPPAWADVRRP